MCIAGQTDAAAPKPGAGTPRPSEWPAEVAASASRPDAVGSALDARPLAAAPSPHAPWSRTSLPSLALTGTTTVSGDENDFVETPRSEVGVPRAEQCQQPLAVPDAGAPPLAEWWCWQPDGVLSQQQLAGQASEWQHDQRQAQVAQACAQSWPVQPPCAQIPQEQELFYVAPFAVVAQSEAHQFMAFDGAMAAPAQHQEGANGRLAHLPPTSAAEGPRGKGKGRGTGGKGKGKGSGKGGSTLAQGRQQGQRDARSGKRPSLSPVCDAAWCDARLADLCAGETRGDALAAVCGQALQLSLDKAGTRVVQRALEVADKEARDALLAELSGHTLEMMESPHANYVAQKVFEVLPAESLGAVIKDFEGRVERVARHRYGCRILIQLFAHCLKQPECAKLVDELLSKADELCCHMFAHHVIEAILEHTHDDQHKHRIYCALSADILGNAQHYHGSFVMRAALAHCSDGDVKSLCESLTDRVGEVTATRIGWHLYLDLCAHPRVRQWAVAPPARHAARPCQFAEGPRGESKLSPQPVLEADWEVSTLSAASSARGSGGEESASPSCTASVASSTPLASPRRQRWADITEDAGLLLPPPPPPPPPPPLACARPQRDRRRKQMNASPAAWHPADAAQCTGVAQCAPPAVVDPEARALTAQVAGLMEQLQATFNCGGAPVKVEVLGGELSQCCVVMWIRPEDSWLTESLLTAAKEALLRISSERSGVYVLGFNGRPFTPQPNGFSGILAKIEDKSQACWEMYKHGACGRGAACRWQHPTVGFPVNVLVAAAASADAPAA